ncbi:MAG TPA: hypothetical protein VFW82_15175 [Dyella sp.]|nr:hypothetical protein [Dyella sp.]
MNPALLFAAGTLAISLSPVKVEKNRMRAPTLSSAQRLDHAGGA